MSTTQLDARGLLQRQQVVARCFLSIRNSSTNWPISNSLSIWTPFTFTHRFTIIFWNALDSFSLGLRVRGTVDNPGIVKTRASLVKEDTVSRPLNFHTSIAYCHDRRPLRGK